jgi:hypothetical protein
MLGWVAFCGGDGEWVEGCPRLFCLQGLPHKVKNEVNTMLAHASIVLWADQLPVS